MDDRSDRVEEGEGAFAGLRGDGFGELRARSAGPVAMIAGRSGSEVDPFAHDLMLGWALDVARHLGGKAIAVDRQRRAGGDAMLRPPARMISEPSARISWWSRPTALCSASSERKLFEQTISARPIGLMRRRRVARRRAFR